MLVKELFALFGSSMPGVVCMLNSRLSCLGMGPDYGTAFCPWANHFTIRIPLFTQVYKWQLGNFYCLVAGDVTLQCTSIPSRGGGGSIPGCMFMLQKPLYSWHSI